MYLSGQLGLVVGIIVVLSFVPSQCHDGGVSGRSLQQSQSQLEGEVNRNELIQFCDLSVSNDVCLAENATVQIAAIRVIGGKEALPERWPYLLSLQTVDEDKNSSLCRRHFCGATLISPKLALTSAHCIWSSQYDKRSPVDREYPDKITVSGSIDQDIYVGLAPQCRHFWGKESRKVVSYYHPKFFSPASLRGDIAVLVLDQPFENVQPVRYRLLENNVNYNASSTWLTTVGWGAVSSFESTTSNTSAVEPLQQGHVMYMSTDECKAMLKETNADSFMDPQLMFCAQNDEVDACLGDSGGPLLIADEQGETPGDPRLDVQVGIVSWGTQRSCSSLLSKQDPGVYTRVDVFADWLDSIVSNFTDVSRSSQIVSQYITPPMQSQAYSLFTNSTLQIQTLPVGVMEEQTSEYVEESAVIASIKQDDPARKSAEQDANNDYPQNSYQQQVNENQYYQRQNYSQGRDQEAGEQQGTYDHLVLREELPYLPKIDEQIESYSLLFDNSDDVDCQAVFTFSVLIFSVVLSVLITMG